MTDPRRIATLAEIDPDAQGDYIAFAILHGVEIRQTKAGKPFATCDLGDTTRRVTARIWAEAEEALRAVRTIPAGTPVKVLFTAERYRDELQLNVRRLRAAEPGEFDETLLRNADVCRFLVFDVETVPAYDRRDLPTTVAETVARHAEKHNREESMVMALSPFLGKVVSLAFTDGAKSPGDREVKALVVPPPGSEDDALPEWMQPMEEAELLRAFWQLAAGAETVVTFNGISFDVPFLIGRSVVHDVEVPVDLVSSRGLQRPHLDVLRLMAAGGRLLGPSTLDVVCLALGIESPKVQMDGSMVAPAYQKGEIRKIAEYNAQDVRATAAILDRVPGWR